jgi:nitrogen fixation/metabolism regulation signal transduction histidine kinase
VESLLLALATAAAAALLVLAVAAARSTRPLRTRLLLTLVALALVPSLLTLVALWRELAPRARLRTARGVERSTAAALAIARHTLAVRHDAAAARAAAVAARLALEPALALADAAPADAATIVYDSTERVLDARGAWGEGGAARFLAQPAVAWPAATLPPQIHSAPDSTWVVAAVAAVPDRSARHVLVALPLPPDEAAALLAVVESVQQSQRLDFLEDLRLRTAARLMAVFALVNVLLAVLLGIQLARRLTRPIERLQRAFEAVAGGDLGHQVEIGREGDTEIGRLLRGFNTMSRDLRDSKVEVVRTARLAAWQGVARRLAHEIKNPLTPITLSIHRLRTRGGDRDAVARECLDTILEETSHLERLANEFSSFARLPKPELRAVDPVPVLQQVLDLYAAHPNVAVRARLDGMPPVWADRDQLRQVCTNLAKNAVEAMPAGGTLDVEWQRDGDHLAITFTDSGGGFTPAALDNLFDPTFTTKPTGSGLGLAIVQRIVADHGGALTAGNGAGGGAWVRVELRLADRTAA